MMSVSTKTHGIMDLVYAATFLAAPFILQAATRNGSNGRGGRGRKKGRSNGVENILLPSIGAGILAEGVMTDHELGAVKALSMPAHLKMDLGISAFIMAAPWIFKMRKETRIPMVALGAVGLGLALMTERQPKYNLEDPIDEELDILIEEVTII